MKFIAGLRVWGNWEIGENVLKVFLRLRGSANRRVDLFLPLIASIWSSAASAGLPTKLGRGTLLAIVQSGPHASARGHTHGTPRYAVNGNRVAASGPDLSQPFLRSFHRSARLCSKGIVGLHPVWLTM